MFKKFAYLFVCQLLALTTGGGIYANAQSLVINEIMQSNIDCIMDELNDFPDSWIELYNAGTETVPLHNYSIAIKNKDLPEKAFRLRVSQDVAPGEYVVIYCDKVGTGLHTDFRLESGKGCNVYLFCQDELADEIEGLKKMPAPNIAYGRVSDGADKWGYQAVTTPGSANCGTVLKNILPDPVFSVPGRVGEDPCTVELSAPEGTPEGTVVRFTLDGSEPTEESTLYESPIDIDKTTMVRAKLFCEGYLSPRSVTHSYIFHGREVTLPVLSIVSDHSYFYDNQTGILVKGTYNASQPNYKYNWRRPINLEYFETADMPAVISQLCETKVKGGASRDNPLRSLAFYANKRFGEKRFTCEFFPDQTPGISVFKSFEARSAGNDFYRTYMRDDVIQQCIGMNVAIDWQPSRPAIIYINGVYKGITNIRPRSDEDHVFAFYDGLEDVDVIENWRDLEEGSLDNFNAFKKFYNEDGHTFSEYEALMDVSEFCDYMLTNIFFDNKDFPGNNVVMWRPTAEDGRWRWIVKDTDFGMGLPENPCDFPTITWITDPTYPSDFSWGNSEEGTALFRRLLATEEFKEMFIERAAVYMGDFFSADAVTAVLDSRYDEIKYEWEFHNQLYIPWKTDFSDDHAFIREWNKGRVPYFYNHMSEYFDLGKPVAMTVGKGVLAEDEGDIEDPDPETPEQPEDPDPDQEDNGNGDNDSEIEKIRRHNESVGISGRALVVNGVRMKAEEFNGKYFAGRTLTIDSEGSADDPLTVKSWKVVTTDGENTETTTHEGKTLSIEMPSAEEVHIYPELVEHTTGIETVGADKINVSESCEVFDLTGRSLGQHNLNDLPRGIYILRQGNSVKKFKH